MRNSKIEKVEHKSFAIGSSFENGAFEFDQPNMRIKKEIFNHKFESEAEGLGQATAAAATTNLVYNLYKCKICLKEFNRTSNLETDIKPDLGENPTCKECLIESEEKSFKSSKHP